MPPQNDLYIEKVSIEVDTIFRKWIIIIIKNIIGTINRRQKDLPSYRLTIVA